MATTTTQTTQVFYPALRYADAHAAIDWLCKAFGFEVQVVYDGPGGTVAHAELTLSGAVFMLGSVRDAGAHTANTPKQLGDSTGAIYVYSADPDAHFQRANAAGARIIKEPYDTEYGSREYAVLDVENYSWSFGTYRP